ncbi:MAG: hypothetical protein SNJ71_06750 [Bacteroidales bacterium]
MKRESKQLFIMLCIMMLTNSCTIFETRRLAECSFQIEKLENIKVSGISVFSPDYKPQIGFKDMAVLSQGFMKGELPLECVVHIGVNNPNDKKAAVNAIKWIALIDGQEIAHGELERRFEIAPKQKAVFPMNVNVNIATYFQNGDRRETFEKIKGFFTQANLPERLSIKVKPSMRIGRKSIYYPGYITIKYKDK